MNYIKTKIFQYIIFVCILIKFLKNNKYNNIYNNMNNNIYNNIIKVQIPINY